MYKIIYLLNYAKQPVAFIYLELQAHLKAKNIKLIKNYLWDTLEIDWKEVTVTFNGNKIDLPRIVIIKFQDEFRVRRLMNREPLLFHLMLKQGITWFTLAAGTQETV